MELSGKMQDLQNEINCTNDSKDFQDADSIRSGNSHVTSRPVSFPPHPIPEGMLRQSFVSPSRREGPPSIWDTHPDIGSQEEARPQQFVIGNDEAELDLSVETRSLVNRVNDQVRKRQKRISNVTEDGEKHSMILGMFIRVKELLDQLSIHCETQQISHSNKCSTYLQDWCLNKMRSQDWKQLVGELFMEILVNDW